MADKRSWLTVLLMTLVLGICGIGTANAQTSIQGAWEMRNDGVLWVISFIDDTFAVYRNGRIYVDGLYTLEPSAWGVTDTSNPPRNLYMEFGLERSSNGFTYNISANELVLSNPLRSFDGYLILDQRGLPLGRYRRGTEPSEAGNPLIGVWRYDYKDDEGKDATEVFRFFPNGSGVCLTFTRQRNVQREMAGITNFTYEFGATRRTGQVSLIRIINWGTMESGVYRVLPFTIDDDILRFEGFTAEYKKR